MSEHRTWWTVRDLADHYRISVRTIYAEIETARLAAHRLAGLVVRRKLMGRSESNRQPD